MLCRRQYFVILCSVIINHLGFLKLANFMVRTFETAFYHSFQLLVALQILLTTSLPFMEILFIVGILVVPEKVLFKVNINVKPW